MSSFESCCQHSGVDWCSERRKQANWYGTERQIYLSNYSKGDFAMTTSILTRKGQPVEPPPFINFLFNDKRAAVLWLFVRVWLGWQWISSGLEKMENPGWMQTGEALKGFWTRAVQIPAEGRPPISYDWYRSFLQSMLDSGSYVWF